MTISARIVADSIGEHSPRLTTLQLRYPKFIHGEFMTHRVFSRNASSSRAIPVERLIKDVIEDPVYPSHWGANQKGMQADEECDTRVGTWDFDRTNGDSWNREGAWKCARDHAITFASAFTEAGYHKQIVNRLLEPFCHINVVVTATEWSNFFALRLHRDAQPEIRLLAEAMREALAESAPNPKGVGSWHLPYVDYKKDFGVTGESHCKCGAYPGGICDGWCRTLGVKLSVARCARVSYLTQEGKVPSIEEDLALYDRLAGSVPLHASPMEHQATPDTILEPHTDRARWDSPYLHANLRGWIQYRKTLPGECQ